MFKHFNNKGVKKCRQNLRNQMVGAEIVLWSKLKSRQVKGLKFRRQQSIDKYILDFYCPEYKIGIELDGNTHDSTFEYDSARQKYIESFGVKVLRYSNSDIYNNLNEVLENIIENVMRRKRATET